MWFVLIANLAVVALFVSLWVHAQQVLERHPRRYRKLAFATAMGLAALATMQLPVELVTGAPFDLRAIPIALSGFFGGPVIGLAAALLAAGGQLLLGGAGLWPGLAVIVLTAVVATGCRLLSGRRCTPLALLSSSVLIGIGTACGFSLLPAAADLGGVLASAALIAPLVTIGLLLASAALRHGKRLAFEHTLLKAAVTEAPDFFYIKNTTGRFIATNLGVARELGFTGPRQLVGKLEAEAFPPGRAEEVAACDAEIVRTDAMVNNIEEAHLGSDGEQRWHSTSKSTLHDSEGNVIGLVGVTRDITDRRRLEEKAARDHNLVSFALTEMSDGLAMFDDAGYLVLCNQRYAELFPLPDNRPHEGAHIHDILAAVVAAGEQLALPDDPQAQRAWVERIALDLRHESQIEVGYKDARWLQIRTRPTSDGSSLIVVSDITAIKNSELSLQGMTDQLKELATTDGLTGLFNRRSFDQIFGNELARTARERQPVSLLMIDVDRFKAYNDCYGHQAGDKCLKLVASSLRDAALRPGDSLARYGGEEFVAVLPNTDEDGAYVIAERLRRSLRDLALPHEASEKGVITVSVGIASYPANAVDRSEVDLLRRADQALYDAKAAGRDRVTGFRGTLDVVPRRLRDGDQRLVRSS